MMTLQPAPYSKDYEITDAMFALFRAPGGVKYFWRLFAWSTALFSIANMVLIPLFFSSYIDFIADAARLEDNPGDIGEVFGTMGSFLGAMTLASLGWAAICSICYAAFYRNYFFGDDEGTVPFRLGRDELNQFLAFLGVYLAFIVFTIGVTLAFTIIIMVVIGIGVAVSGGGEPNPILAAIGILLFIGLYIGLFVALIWFMIKIMFANPLTALRGRVHVLSARHVSKGRFWPALGSVVVAYLVGYVVSYTLMMIAFMVTFSGLSAGDVFSLLVQGQADDAVMLIRETLETGRFKVAAFFAIILASAGYAFLYLMLAGPPAFFTKQWAEAGGVKRDEAW